MTRRSRLAALAAVAALAFSACANNDAKKSDVVNAMTDAGLDDTQAECIGTGVEDAFGDDQDLFNDIAGADDLTELPEETQSQISDILDECLGGGSGAGDDGGDEGDTSDSTEADADTTDTSAEG